MVLLELNYPNETLQEIEKAIESNFPADKVVRLHMRAAECYRSMQKIDDCLRRLILAESSLNNALITNKRQRDTWLEKIAQLREKSTKQDVNPEKSSRIKSLTFTRPRSETIKPSNSDIVAASDSVTLVETLQSGRGFVAKRDIDVGEILFVERPYVARLTSECFLTHCYTCLLPTFNMIPCTRCSLVGFCCEDCLNIASLQDWPLSVDEPECGLGHYWECCFLHCIYAPENPPNKRFSAVTSLKMIHLAISTIARTDPLVVLKAVCASRGLDCPTLPIPFRSDDYAAAYSIVTNANKRTNADLLARSILSIFLIKLFKWCGYLSIAEKSLDEIACVGNEIEREIMLASALLTHLQALPCNAHDVAEQIINLTTCPEPRELACALYPSLSLINHSCDPNVIRISMHRGICQVRSLSVIGNGEPILDNYSCHYAVMALKERRDHLQKQYLFSCQCTGCVNDYPSYEAAIQCSEKQCRFKCLKCNNHFGDSTPANCPSCGISLQSIWSDLNSYRGSFPNYIANLVSSNQNEVCTSTVEQQAKHYLYLLHSVMLKPGGIDYHQAAETLKMLWTCQGNSLLDPYC